LPAIRKKQGLQRFIAIGPSEQAVVSNEEPIMPAHSTDSALLMALMGWAVAASVASPGSAGETSSLLEIRVLNPEEATKPLEADIPTSCPGFRQGSSAERPPWVVRLDNGTLRCFIGTSHAEAYNVRPGRSLLSDRDALQPETGQLASLGLLLAMDYPAPDQLRKRPEYWRTHYYGVTSVHRVAHPQTGEPCLVAVLHGENNDRSWSKQWAEKNHHSSWFYPNTLLPVPEGPPKENEMFGRYFGFVGLAWCPEREAGGADFMAHDLGPVVWPEAGYLDAEGNQCSQGVRHPYGFVQGDWFYIFYLDTKDCTIRAARAPLKSLFEPAAFRLCCQGQFGEPALPSALPSGDRVCLTQKPGRSDAVLPGRPRSMRFQATHIKGTPYFLGVEHREFNRGGEAIYEVWLHLSRDLIHWSEGTPVPGTRGGYYASELGQRPVAVNRDYSAHDEIDPKGFYLAGRKLRVRSGIYVRFTQIELVERAQQ
jgi:hypothetical protein